ncbi:MAG: hypothetical protein IH616_05115, partial [Gemmatimonadales bacterium]|nr:hypothetical protein [Gemmatimonadales bacterium]
MPGTPDPLAAELRPTAGPVVGARAPDRVRGARPDLLRTGAILVALFTAAPVIALGFVAASQGEIAGTLDHLFATVLPGYMLTTAWV